MFTGTVNLFAVTRKGKPALITATVFFLNSSEYLFCTIDLIMTEVYEILQSFRTFREITLTKGRVSAAEIKEAMKSVLTLARPMVIAADGLPLIEDVGGPYGFMEFLKGEGMYEDREESLAWAKGNGWTGKIGNLKTLL